VAYGPFGPLGHLELHVLVLLEAAEAVAIDLGVVPEDVRAISAGDETTIRLHNRSRCPVHSRPPAVARDLGGLAARKRPGALAWSNRSTAAPNCQFTGEHGGRAPE